MGRLFIFASLLTALGCSGLDVQQKSSAAFEDDCTHPTQPTVYENSTPQRCHALFPTVTGEAPSQSTSQRCARERINGMPLEPGRFGMAALTAMNSHPDGDWSSLESLSPQVGAEWLSGETTARWEETDEPIDGPGYSLSITPRNSKFVELGVGMLVSVSSATSDFDRGLICTLEEVIEIDAPMPDAAEITYEISSLYGCSSTGSGATGVLALMVLGFVCVRRLA